MILVNTSLDNQNLLRALEVFLVALIWLFFFRVIRAVWVEVRPPRQRRGAMLAASPQVAGAAPMEARRDRSSRYRLRVIEPDELRGSNYEIPEEVTVGRAGGCGVRIDDAYTSNLHARLFRRDGTLWVEDLDSTNGTWVNAQRISSPVRLGKGDLVQVGGTVFEVAR